MYKNKRSLIIGIVFIFLTVIYIVMSSYKVAILSGALSMVWLGKAFMEWKENKRKP